MQSTDAFLKSQKILRLGTVSVGGSGSGSGNNNNDDGKKNTIMTPHVVPVWYTYEDGAFYIGTNKHTKKARNVAEMGRASFCVDVGVHSPDIYGVAGYGKADLLYDDITKIATKILLRYYDSIEESAAAQLLADTDCIIRITPESISTWSY